MKDIDWYSNSTIRSDENIEQVFIENLRDNSFFLNQPVTYKILNLLSLNQPVFSWESDIQYIRLGYQ